jgi:prepilin-type N-terminal cleavage/methylation domain-containing protein
MGMGASKRIRANRGFSILELVAVLAVVGALGAMAVPISRGFIRSSSADSSVVQLQAALDMAHDRAVAERRNFILTLTPPRTIQVSRQEINALGAVTGTTVVETFGLENNQQFLRFAGMIDTPDTFGGAAAINFTGTAPVMFTSDGSLVDSNGDVVNGTVFIGTPNEPISARAVSVFGVTGLMRTWKWRGAQWME